METSCDTRMRKSMAWRRPYVSDAYDSEQGHVC